MQHARILEIVQRAATAVGVEGEIGIAENQYSGTVMLGVGKLRLTWVLYVGESDDDPDAVILDFSGMEDEDDVKHVDDARLKLLIEFIADTDVDVITKDQK